MAGHLFKEFSKAYIFENLRVGFKFEMFSPMSREHLATDISRALGRRVEPLETHSPDFPLNEMQFKLEPDFAGGMKMHELITAPLQYFEAIHILYKVCNFIAEHAYTTDRSRISIGLSIAPNAPLLRVPITQLNVLKFVVGLDEARIFEMWPTVEKSKVQKLYKSPVAYIYPKNRFISETFSAATMTSSANYNLPQSKYYGIDFTKLREGYIGVNYAGGINYETKKSQLTDLINLVGEHLYTTLESNNVYTESEVRRVESILEKQKTTIMKLRTYENMLRSYPEIKFTVDRRDSYELCKARYLQLREGIATLFEHANLQKAEVNYDSERNRLQVKGAKINSPFVLEGYDFIECTLEAEMHECVFFNCKVVSSLLEKCFISHGNELRYCFLENCRYSTAADSTIKRSYLRGQPTDMISGRISECIINRGMLSENSTVDSKTEMIRVESGKPKMETKA